MYDFVFIVLVYKNTLDLEEFFLSLYLLNTKVIVVDSFYDEVTSMAFENIALKYSASYLRVENRGYGYGNNMGVKYALAHYSFRYLIISNADIVVKQLDISDLNEGADSIIAPQIRNLRGKDQNPFIPFYVNGLNHLKYIAFKYNWHFIRILCFILYRFVRECYLAFIKIFRRNITRIYAAHGSFIIIPESVLIRLTPLFNEQMFLFVEEEHLAKLAHSKNISIIFNSRIKILHKEDGSVGGAIKNNYEITKKSFIEFYINWYKKHRF